MKVFIDANKYLDLLRFYKNENSKEILTFLKDKQKDGIFTVVVTDQAVDEFRRNKYSLRGKQIVTCTLQMQAPSYLKNSQEIKRINKIKKNIGELIKKVQEDYLKKLESQDKKIEKFLVKTQKIITTPEIINKANLRIQKGNPPEKTRSCIRDAISWEALLEHFSNEDLIILSRDSDFSDKLYKVEDDKINPFLENEWKSKNNKTVRICHSFSGLIDLFSTEQEKEKEEIKSIRAEERSFVDRPQFTPTTHPNSTGGFIFNPAVSTAAIYDPNINYWGDLLINPTLDSSLLSTIQNELDWNSNLYPNNLIAGVNIINCSICKRFIGKSENWLITPQNIICSECSQF